MLMKFILRAGAAAVLCAAPLATAYAAHDQVWDFKVYLNDDPVGYDQFVLKAGEGGALSLEEHTHLDIKVLFVTAYRFSHDSTESWSGDCLRTISAQTDDDGKPFKLEGRGGANEFSLEAGGRKQALPACIMNYAYWNPAILRQKKLLNDQTGEYETVTVSKLGEEPLAVRGESVSAQRYRISGIKYPVDLWYVDGKDLVALEFAVDGGRKLRYRLK